MNAVRVGLDALHFSRQTFGHPRPVVHLAVGVLEGDVGVRVDDAGHPEVLVDALATALYLAFMRQVISRPCSFMVPSWRSQSSRPSLVFVALFLRVSKPMSTMAAEVSVAISSARASFDRWSTGCT